MLPAGDGRQAIHAAQTDPAEIGHIGRHHDGRQTVHAPHPNDASVSDVRRSSQRGGQKSLGNFHRYDSPSVARVKRGISSQ